MFCQSHHNQLSAPVKSSFSKTRYVSTDAKMESKISICRHLFEMLQTILNFLCNKQVSNVPFHSLQNQIPKKVFYLHFSGLVSWSHKKRCEILSYKGFFESICQKLLLFNDFFLVKVLFFFLQSKLNRIFGYFLHNIIHDILFIVFLLLHDSFEPLLI